MDLQGGVGRGQVPLGVLWCHMPHPQAFNLHTNVLVTQSRNVVMSSFLPHIHAWDTDIMLELLSRLGWSQVYFARRIGVAEKTVNRWCAGNPNPVAMAYLEFACGVNQV